MAKGARLIASELDRIAPGGGWHERADAYAGELLALDEEIRATLAAVPPEGRTLVTNHRSFGYFADRYGFDVVGTVIPGGSAQAEPSSAELADLVAVIEETGVPAVFGETSNPSTLPDAVAAELGEDVEVVDLYTGSLGAPGSGAETLIGMLRTDTARIAEALS
jgi:zinc/manganese transport system substrate-binding protein